VILIIDRENTPYTKERTFIQILEHMSMTPPTTKEKSMEFSPGLYFSPSFVALFPKNSKNFNILLQMNILQRILRFFELLLFENFLVVFGLFWPNTSARYY
jgi:hypothetical protein